MNIKFFDSREQMYSILRREPDQWEMCLRNTAYGKCYGIYDDFELVCAGSFSVFQNENGETELHIYTLEVKDELKGMGYGRSAFNMILSMYKGKIDIMTLEYLDDDAEAFWKKMGFVNTPDGESDETMTLYLN